MTDAEALLAAILANPGEDVPRLVYADCIEEQGQRERAEFIRVQVEIENGLPCEWINESWNRDRLDCAAWNKRVAEGRITTTCKSCRRFDELCRRERELLGNHIEWAESLARIWHPDSLRSCNEYGHSGCWDRIRGGIIAWKWLRGFIGSIELPWDDWRTHAAAILAAQPVTQVTLTTRPSYREMEKLSEITGCDWRPGDESEWWIRVLVHYWPRITFSLPSGAGVPG